MKILKHENWWVWLILSIFTFGISNIFLGNLLGCFEKDKWYSNPINWALGIVFMIFPFLIMLTILTIEMTINVAKKLNVSGVSIYTSSYIWIIFIIIPILGWTLFIVLYIYLVLWIILRLKDGFGENYIED